MIFALKATWWFVCITKSIWTMNEYILARRLTQKNIRHKKQCGVRKTALAGKDSYSVCFEHFSTWKNMLGCLSQQFCQHYWHSTQCYSSAKLRNEFLRKIVIGRVKATKWNCDLIRANNEPIFQWIILCPRNNQENHACYAFG